jgi:hypothetical protein
MFGYRLGNLLGVFDASQAELIGTFVENASLLGHVTNLVGMIGTPSEEVTLTQRLVELSYLLGNRQDTTLTDQLVSIS